MARATALSFAFFVANHATGMQLRNEASTQHLRESFNPIMMFTHGCSCTTAGIEMVGKILRAHDIEPANTGHGELMKSLALSANYDELKHNMGEFGWTWENKESLQRVLDSTDLLDKFKIVYDWTKNTSQTVFFKNELSIATEHEAVMSYLKMLQTKAFLYLRTNIVDVGACRVMDFCDKPENEGLGSRVDADGNDLGCGFRGRGENEDKDVVEYVKFNTATLLTKLQMQDKKDLEHAEYLKANGWDDTVYSAEDLLGFEYGDASAFAKSVEVWTRLIASFGITPNQQAIEETLRAQDKFPAPKKHSAVIYNFDEVKVALQGSRFYAMLRM